MKKVAEIKLSSRVKSGELDWDMTDSMGVYLAREAHDLINDGVSEIALIVYPDGNREIIPSSNVPGYTHKHDVDIINEFTLSDIEGFGDIPIEEWSVDDWTSWAEYAIPDISNDIIQSSGKQSRRKTRAGRTFEYINERQYNSDKVPKAMENIQGEAPKNTEPGEVVEEYAEELKQYSMKAMARYLKRGVGDASAAWKLGYDSGEGRVKMYIDQDEDPPDPMTIWDMAIEEFQMMVDDGGVSGKYEDPFFEGYRDGYQDAYSKWQNRGEVWNNRGKASLKSLANYLEKKAKDEEEKEDKKDKPKDKKDSKSDDKKDNKKNKVEQALAIFISEGGLTPEAEDQIKDLYEGKDKPKSKKPSGKKPDLDDEFDEVMSEKPMSKSPKKPDLDSEFDDVMDEKPKKKSRKVRRQVPEKRATKVPKRRIKQSQRPIGGGVGLDEKSTNELELLEEALSI